MKKIMIIALICVIAASCSTGPKPMYSWYDYDDDTYAYLKKGDKESLEDLIETYEKIIATQKGTRKTVPPGIYADYGFVLIQAKKTEEGKKMLMMESELYPESSVFVNSVIRMIEK